MSINSNIKIKVEEFLGEEIVSDSSVSGGCIADSRIIKMASGKTFFLKTHSGKPKMFLKEANGLNEMAQSNSIRIPKVLLTDESFLLLENIEPGIKTNDFFKHFGRDLAQMHKQTSKEYGFYEDNYIGANIQYNVAQGSEKKHWTDFYFQKRILAQFKMAETNGYATTELSSCVIKLEKRIAEIFKGSEELPTLLHGDLWGGNYLCDSNKKGVLIDPAVYYGHREADLAMTKMFGGFTFDFYSSYHKSFPLAQGWEYRENMYLLYHYMNHLNLFGRGYYQTTIDLLKYYL